MHTKRTIVMVTIVISLIWGIPHAKAVDYDVTNCYSGTVTILFSSEKLTVLSYEYKGICTSNIADKTFDNATLHCVGITRIVGKEVSYFGNCKYQIPDGSIEIVEFDGKNREGTWKTIYGTGKLEGMEGGGLWKAITAGKPIVPGTFQECNRGTGKFTLPR